MVLTKTPICNFGEKPHSFELKDVSKNLSILRIWLEKRNIDHVYL